jgi:hypothetical protein
MKKEIALVALSVSVSLVSFGQFWNVSEPMRLGGTVNTDAEESIPVFSEDSSKLYFVRTYDDRNSGGQYDQDIWVSTREANGDYSECVRLKELNNKFNNAIQGIGSKGSIMYLLNAYDGKKDVVKGLTVTKSEGNGWSNPEKVDIPGLDIEGDYYGFHINKDAVIISYQGLGSLGSEDLYVSTRIGNGWSAPVHMGDVLNTAGFEISPFLSKNSDTLFFSSDGHGGYGDADIFYSVKQGGWSDWSKPVNLGNVINSPKFDAYFTHSNNQAFWSSNRDGELSDIYLLNIMTPPPLFASAIGTDVTVYQGSDGQIDLTPEGGVPPYAYAWSNGMTVEDPNDVPKGSYTVIVTDKLGQTAEVIVPIDEPGPPLIANFEFKHYFGYNKNQLAEDRSELDSFLAGVESQVASTDRSVKVLITSSASHVPTKTFKSNDKLARTRADNMLKLLEEHFEGKGIADKVELEIITVTVAGPKYENDSDNAEKYGPHQFVTLKSE